MVGASMQLSFDIDGLSPEAGAARRLERSGQDKDLAPRADLAQCSETAENQADIPLTGAFDAKGTSRASPSPESTVDRALERAEAEHDVGVA
jgi:hypothetical protein